MDTELETLGYGVWVDGTFYFGTTLEELQTELDKNIPHIDADELF